jgi:hypothetical protein
MMTAERRRYAAFAGLLLVALVAWLFLRRGREPRWSIVLEAEQSPVTPWRDIRVQASIQPASAVRNAEKWHWSWKADSTPLAGHEPKVAWRTADLGGHTIQVTVESEWGTRRTASVDVEVQLVSYMSPTGKLVPPAPPPPAKELPFEIADISVEKDEVCQGEPSRIRMTPRDKRGEEKWLTPLIDGKRGWEVPFIAQPSEPGMRKVQVSLADARTPDGGAVSTDVYILVKDCMAPFPLYLTALPAPPDDGYIAFEARMFDGPAWEAFNKAGPGHGKVPLANPASYRWTFGDGKTETSTTSDIRHHYPQEADRPDERATMYVASVDALDASGNKMATAYAAVELLNLLRAFKRENGLIKLVIEQSPMASKGPDGSMFTDVTAVNIDPVETARLTQLTVTFKPCDGSDPTPMGRSVQSVFSDTRIPPKGRLAVRMTISAHEAEGICWASAHVEGDSEPGQFKVAGDFTLDTGQNPGRRLNAKQQETVHEALKALGRRSDEPGGATITMSEIRRLEDEGKIPRGVLRKDPFITSKVARPE